MKMMHLTRRGFLRAACVVAGGAMISLRMAGVAVARFRDIRDYMLDRIHGVYGADARLSRAGLAGQRPGQGTVCRLSEAAAGPAFRKTAAYPLGRPVRRVSPSGGGGDVPQSP